MKHSCSLLLMCTFLWLTSCNNSDGLDTVSGIEGEIQIQGVLPDSIEAIALVILETEALDDQDNIGKYLVSYSDPIVQSSDYFIQLRPGFYMGVLVGLTIDPGLFVVNIDSYLDSSDIPLVQLTQDPIGLFIREGKTSYLDWDVAF